MRCFPWIGCIVQNLPDVVDVVKDAELSERLSFQELFPYRAACP